MILTNYMTNDLPDATGAMSRFPYSPQLAVRYKFKTTYGDDVDMAIRQGNALLVPRETCPTSPNDYRVTSDTIALKCNFSPRNPEQLPVAEKLVKLLSEGHNGIADAPTGWGKTVVGSLVAAKLGQTTMIVVTKEDLMKQWRSALITVLGISPTLIGHVQQDVCDWQGKRVVIGMAHSLVIPDRYPSEMYKYFGLLMLDEVHQLAADTFIRACQMFPAKLRLGWSATVERADGKTALLRAHIGPVIAKGTIVPMAPKVLIKRTGWKIPTRKVFRNGMYVEEKIPHKPGQMMLVAKAMISSPVRNMEMVNFCKQCYDAGRRILFMSDIIAHLNNLFHLLADQGIPGEDMAYYIGGLKPHEIERAKKSRIVLGTYKMCSTGTDVPAWDTLIMATPRVDVTQAMGRVMREMEGKRQPIIFELLDHDKIFSGFHMSRLKQYYSKGATIIDMDKR